MNRTRPIYDYCERAEGGTLQERANVFKCLVLWQRVLAVHSLTQHVSVPTHNLGHTLDVVITHDEQTLESVTFDPPMLSDYSQIVAKLSVRLPHSHTGVRRVRRCWRQLDMTAFNKIYYNQNSS